MSQGRLDVELLAWWWSQPFKGRHPRNPDGSYDEARWIPGLEPMPTPTSDHPRTQACLAAIAAAPGGFWQRRDLISLEEWQTLIARVAAGPPWGRQTSNPLPPMPPLDPDAFLRWRAEQDGVEPLALTDLAWQLRISEPEARLMVVSAAARERKRARLLRLGITES